MKKKIIVGLCSLLILGFLLTLFYVKTEDYRWRTNLVHAIEKNDDEQIGVLLSEPKHNINGDGNVFLQYLFGSEVSSSTPLEAALDSNDLEILKKILDYDGINPISNEVNAVGWIVYCVNDGTWVERHGVIEMMMQKGFDPDYIAEDGAATLCDIAGESAVDDSSGRIDDKKARGILALYKFVASQCKNVKQKDSVDGSEPIHCAAEGLNPILMEYLINDQGYSVNQQNNEGETPLIYMIKYLYPYEIPTEALLYSIDFLIENNADLTIKDGDGKTAYDYAKTLGLKEVTERLRVAKEQGAVR